MGDCLTAHGKSLILQNGLINFTTSGLSSCSLLVGDLVLFPPAVNGLTALFRRVEPVQKKFVVRLSQDEREQLGSLVKSGKASALKLVLGAEVSAWQAERNRTANQIHWQFTTADARRKLRRLYPAFLRHDENQETKPFRQASSTSKFQTGQTTSNS